MRKIGLIGGMSWESTVTYYQLLNRGVQARLGGLHSADLLLASVDFAPIADLQHDGQWQALGEVLGRAGQGLADAGAEGLVICTNTMHKVADQVETASALPLIHIVDATAERLLADNCRTVGVLGTRFTMEDAFFRDRLARHGINMIVPDDDGRDEVHRIIYEELCRGEIHNDSRTVYRRIMAVLADEGAQGIVFGCTEIGLLVSADDSPLPVYDTAVLHAEAAVDWMLAEEGADVVWNIV